MKKWFSILQSNKGFSLIEAIVTVAIVGIAMVPISMVFTQTIHTTVDTRKQLEANELAQEYIEAIKAKSLTSLSDLFCTGAVDIDTDGDGTNDGRAKELNASTTASEFEAIGLKVLPKNFKATISYNDRVDLPAYTIADGHAPVEVDTIITIDSGHSPTIQVDDGLGTSLPSGTVVTNKRVILLQARRNTGKLIVSYFDTDSLSGQSASIDLSKKAIRIVIGNDPRTKQLDTIIKVDSNLKERLNVYIYEDKDNQIKATTEIINGVVSISRNLTKMPDPDNNHRIVEIGVEIKDTNNGDKVLAKLTTTKIDE